MAKVYQLKLVKQKLGKYSKVMGYDETMLDETIEVQPEAECVKDDIKTAALEVMDVVDIPKANGESEEVVVVETPKSDDTTIKVQSTETGVMADIPVEAFSKATKISKAKIKAYSEAEAEAKEAEKKEDEPKAEEKPAEEVKEEPKSEEKKDESELKTESEEGEEKKPEEEKPAEEPKAEEKSEGEGEEEKDKLETNSLAISLSTGKVYAYSCEEGQCEEIINEDGELDTVEDLEAHSGKTETYGRTLLQRFGDKVMKRDAKTMEGLAELGVSRKTAKQWEKSMKAKGKFNPIRLGIAALVNAGFGKRYIQALWAKLGGLKGVADKKRDIESLIGQMNGQNPEEVKKVASKLTAIAANEGALDKVAEVKQEYKDKLAAASKTCYSQFFAYKNAPICLGVYSEETNEIVEAKEAEAEKAEEKAEAAAEVAEKAAEVEQPQGTEKLPIVIEKVDNGYTITANGETKIADDVKSICNIVTELLEETKMDSYSKMVERFRNFLNG